MTSEELVRVQRAESTVEQLVEKRRRAWAAGLSGDDVEQDLERAWEELRLSRAEAAHGGAQDIISRARVERELEKLMIQDEVVPEIGVAAAP